MSTIFVHWHQHRSSVHPFHWIHFTFHPSHGWYCSPFLADRTTSTTTIIRRSLPISNVGFFPFFLFGFVPISYNTQWNDTQFFVICQPCIWFPPFCGYFDLLCGASTAPVCVAAVTVSILLVLLSIQMILSPKRTRRRERKTAAASNHHPPRQKREK